VAGFKEVCGIKITYLAGLLAGISVFLLFVARQYRPTIVKERRSASETFLHGTAGFFSPLAGKVYPETVFEDMKQRFLWGGFRDLDVVEFLALKVAAAVIFSGLAALTALFGGNAILMLLLGFLGYIMPDLYLNRKIQDRQARISRDVPDFAVLLATVLDAGGDMQTALIQIGRRLGGEIGKEVETALHEIGSGNPMRTALQNMAGRCGVDELTQLIRAILQAEFYQSPVADSVRAFANQLTMLRRNRAQKRAAEQTVKMLLPMLLFIVLPLMILMVFPAIRQFGRMLN
jgi:tight adherence protein C